jgi:hypothetical protein
VRSTAVLGVVLVLIAGSFARADDAEVKQLRKQIEEVRKAKQEEIDTLTAQKNKVEDQYIEMARAAENAKRVLMDKVDAARKAAADLERDLAMARAKIEALEQKLAAAEKAAPAKPASDPETEAKQKLEQQKLTFNFDETPLEEVVQFLQDFTAMNIVLCGAKSTKVTLEGKAITVKETLDRIAAKAPDLAWEQKRGVVYLLSKKSPSPEAPKPVLPDALRAKLAKNGPTVNLDETPLEDVVALLVESGLEGLSVSHKAKAKAIKVTLRVRGLPLATVLDVLCRVHGLAYRAEGDGLVLDAR